MSARLSRSRVALISVAGSSSSISATAGTLSASSTGRSRGAINARSTTSCGVEKRRSKSGTATQPREEKQPAADGGEPAPDDSLEVSNDDLDLLYDPILNCYYDPKTNKYYELAVG